MNRDDLIDIAASGVLAPSADNAMSFQFEYGADSIVIWADATFSTGLTQHRRLLDLLAYGAMVENMTLRASARGWAAEVRWFPGDDPRQVARLLFSTKDGVGPEPLADAITKRHTNRKLFYRGPPLKPAEKALLSADASVPKGARVVWLEGAARRRALGLVLRAEIERFSQKNLHTELFSVARFDLGQTESAEVALPLGALEIERPMRPIFKACRHWRVMRVANWFGAAQFFGVRAAFVPCWIAPALGVIVTDTTLDRLAEIDIVLGGRSFERVWLRLATLELALQPYAASTTQLFQSDAEQLSRPHTRAALAAGWREILGSATPLIVFRAGRAAPVTARSGRRPIASLERPAKPC